MDSQEYFGTSIKTKRFPAGNNRNAYYKASTVDGKVTARVEEDGSGSVRTEHEHRAAALNLCAKMGWTHRMIGGHTKDGMIWVFDFGK